MMEVIARYKQCDLEKYYPVVCPNCGWKGLSSQCLADLPDECECPKCFTECDEDRKAEVTKCKYQSELDQLKEQNRIAVEAMEGIRHTLDNDGRFESIVEDLDEALKQINGDKECIN